MMMKRSREGAADHDITSLANCLILLSSSGGARGVVLGDDPINRVFTCKTCDRQFPSFQALGGHRASHKKPRVAGDHDLPQPPSSPPKPKTHECPICGIEFAIGQALGGHMRRHRTNITTTKTTTSVVSDDWNGSPPTHPIVKKPNSRRVLCLDLNLTPLENNCVWQGCSSC